MWPLMPPSDAPLCLPYDICCVPQSVQSSRGRPLQSDQHDSASPSSPTVLSCSADPGSETWLQAVYNKCCCVMICGSTDSLSDLFFLFLSLHHIVETWASITCEASVLHLAFWMVHTSHHWTLLPAGLKHRLQREKKSFEINCVQFKAHINTDVTHIKHVSEHLSVSMEHLMKLWGCMWP